MGGHNIGRTANPSLCLCWRHLFGTGHALTSLNLKLKPCLIQNAVLSKSVPAPGPSDGVWASPGAQTRRFAGKHIRFGRSYVFQGAGHLGAFCRNAFQIGTRFPLASQKGKNAVSFFIIITDAGGAFAKPRRKQCFPGKSSFNYLFFLRQKEKEAADSCRSAAS